MKGTVRFLSSVVGILGLSMSLSLPTIAQQDPANQAPSTRNPAPATGAGDNQPSLSPNNQQSPAGSRNSGSQQMNNQNPTQGGNVASPDSAEEQPSVAPNDMQRQRTGSPNPGNQNQAPVNQAPSTRNPAPATGAGDSQPSLSPDNQQSPAGNRNPTPNNRNSGSQQMNNQDPTQGGNVASPDSAEEQPSVAPNDMQRQRTGSPNPGNQNQAPSRNQQTPNAPIENRRGAYPDPIESLSVADAEGMTIDEIVDKNESFELFNALLRVAALEDNNLVSKLSGNRAYTVFAPTDRAFLALPEGTVSKLVKPENRALLIEVLSNHIVAGRVEANAMPNMTASSTGSESTVQSNVPDALGRAQPGSVAADAPAGAVPGPITSEESGSRERTVSYSANTTGTAQVIRADINASNGVIHAIDQVILPADIESRLVTPTTSSSN